MKIFYWLILSIFFVNSSAIAGNDETIISLTNEAIALYNNDKLTDALNLFEKASLLSAETTKATTYSDRAVYFKGIIYYRMGKEYYGKARQYLDHYAEFGVAEDFYQPGMMNALVVLGNMFWNEGNYLKAIELYEKTFRDYPLLPEIPGLKNKIMQFALTPAAARPKVEPAKTPVPADLCSDKKPERYYRFTGPEGDVNELCTTIDGQAVSDISLELYVQDDKGNLIGSMYKHNSELTVYLVKNQQKTPVLTTRGHRLKFVNNPKKVLPDIQITWETYTDETKYLPNSELAHSHDYKTVFTWTGTQYKDREMEKAVKINREALALWQKGKREAAAKKWSKGLGIARQPGYGLSACTELVNNFAFAMSQGHDEGDYAQYFLRYVMAADPKRWQAYLNLGDLLWQKGQKEKAVDYYLKTLIVEPEYRDREKLRDRIEKTGASVAAFHEIATVAVDPRLTNYSITTVMAPFAERYAQATGIDMGKLLDALGVGRQAAKTKALGERSISPSRGENFYSGTVRVFELLRAKLKNRGGDMFLVLYNKQQISDDWSDAYSAGWRLAVIGDDYRPQDTFDLYKIAEDSTAKGESVWPEHPGIVTKLQIEAGVLNVEVQSAAYSRHYSSIGGYRYTFLPRELTLVLKDVERIVVESGDDE